MQSWTDRATRTSRLFPGADSESSASDTRCPKLHEDKRPEEENWSTMAQPSVAAYFATRKRRTSGEILNKTKLVVYEDHQRLASLHEEQRVPDTPTETKMATKKDRVSKNLQFDMDLKSKAVSRPKRTRIKQPPTKNSIQPDIRETLLKASKEQNRQAVSEKLGNLSPKKSPMKRVSRAAKLKAVHKILGKEEVKEEIGESNICQTPKKHSSETDDLSIDEIKTRITTSSRLVELRARIDKFKNCEEKLEQIHKKKGVKNKETVGIKKFDRIEIEIPMSPQKTPRKVLSPSKIMPMSPKISPVKCLLSEPKEAPASSIEGSPTKLAHQVRVDTESSLPLPFKYRFLAEIFRSIDTVCAMMYNRRENITFSKLKPAVQELVRRNFTLDHLAQIKTVYPDAFSFKQAKHRSYGVSNSEKYELIITPILQIDKENSGRNTPDENDVLKSAQQTHMSPSVLLDRRKKFHNMLMNIAKTEHEKFLLSLEKPMKIDKEKLTGWHPEFDLDECRDIQKAELPKAPIQEKATSATEVLERANKFLNQGSRMQKAIEILSDNRSSTVIPTATTHVTKVSESPKSVEVSMVDTPPATPKTEKLSTNPLLKGIPASLLEKIRAKQAAKALEMMTRTPNASKDAVKYARLPEIAKILRNIFVSEKKNVLSLEIAIKKLDDSYRTKLLFAELEEHIRLICKLVPLWASIQIVNKIDYLKLTKDYNMAKVIHRLQILANEKA